MDNGWATYAVYAWVCLFGQSEPPVHKCTIFLQRKVALKKDVAIAKLRYEKLQQTYNGGWLVPLRMPRLDLTWEEANTGKEFKYRPRHGLDCVDALEAQLVALREPSSQNEVFGKSDKATQTEDDGPSAQKTTVKKDEKGEPNEKGGRPNENHNHKVDQESTPDMRDAPSSQNDILETSEKATADEDGDPSIEDDMILISMRRKATTNEKGNQSIQEEKAMSDEEYEWV